MSSIRSLAGLALALTLFAASAPGCLLNCSRDPSDLEIRWAEAIVIQPSAAYVVIGGVDRELSCEAEASTAMVRCNFRFDSVASVDDLDDLDGAWLMVDGERVDLDLDLANASDPGECGAPWGYELLYDDTPDGCEDVLVDKGAFSCGSSFTDACEALSEDADLPVTWLVGWAEDPPTQHQLDCAQAWLDLHGLEGPASSELYFPVDASYSQIAELCRSVMIGVCEPGAVAGACDELDEAACEANALCGPILGQRLDPAGMCMEAPAFTGCMSSADACPAVEVAAEHEDGSCWLFPGGCVPGEPWASGTAACPDTTVFEGVPACG